MWGGGGGVEKHPFFWGSKIMNLLVFLILSRRSVSGSQLHRICVALYALFGHFCYVGGFGDLGDPVVPTPRGVSGDVVTVYAY